MIVQIIQKSLYSTLIEDAVGNRPRNLFRKTDNLPAAYRTFLLNLLFGARVHSLQTMTADWLVEQVDRRARCWRSPLRRISFIFDGDISEICKQADGVLLQLKTCVDELDVVDAGKRNSPSTSCIEFGQDVILDDEADDEVK